MKYIEGILLILSALLYARSIKINPSFVPHPVTFGVWLIVLIANAITLLRFSDQWVSPILGPLGVLVVLSWSMVRIRKRKSIIIIRGYEMVVIVAALVTLCACIFSSETIVLNLVIQLVLIMGFYPLIKGILYEKKTEPLYPWALIALAYALISFDTCSKYHSLESILSMKAMAELLYALVQGFLGSFTICLLVLYQKKKQEKILL